MKPVEEMSFEDAIAELEKVVTELDSGQVTLEESVQSYERGAKLKAHCEKRLKEAELKIIEITSSSNGEVTAKSADDLAG